MAELVVQEVEVAEFFQSGGLEGSETAGATGLLKRAVVLAAGAIHRCLLSKWEVARGRGCSA
jgi:hypothetical protein